MFTILSAFLVIPLQSIGQHHESGEANNRHVQHHSMKGAHRIGLGLGHTSISEGRKDGKTQWLPLASWSLNYDYWISDKWAVGLQNDIILETFIVEKHGEEEIERKNPLSMVPVAMYKFSGRWSVFSGAGIEFSKAKNLGLTRLGVEYGVPISKKWEVGISALWDAKWNFYDSWAVSFTFNKIFPMTTKQSTAVR